MTGSSSVAVFKSTGYRLNYCWRLSYSARHLLRVSYLHDCYCPPAPLKSLGSRHAGALQIRLLLGRVALVNGLQSSNFPVNDLSVGRSVCALVCPVHCGKTAERIRMPFDIIGRTGPGTRQVVGFGDRSTGRGTIGGEFQVCHCNQWGI